MVPQSDEGFEKQLVEKIEKSALILFFTRILEISGGKQMYCGIPGQPMFQAQDFLNALLLLLIL